MAPLRLHGLICPGLDHPQCVTVRAGLIEALEPDKQKAPQWLCLPALVNYHAHADRAFTAPEQRPRSVADAVQLSIEGRSNFTANNVFERACRLLSYSLRHGVVRIRSHTDVDPLVEMRSIEGIGQAKAAYSGQVDLEVIAFSTSRNKLLEAAGQLRVREAVALGADVIGAAPNWDENPVHSVRKLLDLAVALDRPVDIHLDEHLSPQDSIVEALIEGVLAQCLHGRVTLSHGCVLAAMDEDRAARIIDGLAEAGITVAALPEVNLFLQDRSGCTPRARGITRVRELLRAGVPVRFGSDNVRDWFYPFGDGDMLDAALFGAVGAHLDDADDLIAAICDGRTRLEVGDVADLVLIPADSLDDALARRPAGRVTLKAGAVVSGTLTAAEHDRAPNRRIPS